MLLIKTNLKSLNKFKSINQNIKIKSDLKQHRELYFDTIILYFTINIIHIFISKIKFYEIFF